MKGVDLFEVENNKKKFLFFTGEREDLVQISRELKANHRFIRVVNPKTLHFWQSQAKIKALFGANRSGKTETVLIDVVWRLLGEHPFIKVKTPQYIRWLLPNYSQAEITLRPKIERYVHPEFFKGGSWEKAYDRRFNQLKFRNGSVLEFKSHQVPLLNLEGVALDCVVVDEECPYELFQTLVMRTLDRDAQILISATPLKGLSWLWTDVWKKADGKFIFAEHLHTEENDAIPKDSIAKIRRIIHDPRRLEGAFYDIRVFPDLSEEHLTTVPEDGLYYLGYDWGYRHFSAGVVVKLYRGAVYVVDVWTEQFLSNEQAVNQLYDFVVRNGYQPVEICVYDSQLNQKDTDGRQPMEKVVAKFNAVAGTKKEMHSFGVINELLRRNLLFFNKDNPRVLSFFDKLQRYCFDEQKEKIKSTEPDDDIDAFRYVVYWLCEQGYLNWTFVGEATPVEEEEEVEYITYTQRLLEKRRKKENGWGIISYGRYRDAYEG